MHRTARTKRCQWATRSRLRVVQCCCSSWRPTLAGVKLIAEPWDCGPGGYQVGGFPPGWAEWNDKYRDTVRDFWRDHAPLTELAPRLCASRDLFDKGGRRSWACVNFVTAHDGFTLNDVVSYNDKHNEANGEDGKDGSSDNRSWNCGAEGETDDAEINALRERQIRNILSTLLLSQGTPMLLAGDEFGRTQGGNNNAYCQDDEISWLDWNIEEKGEGLHAFTCKLIALRHAYPVLRRARFLTGEMNEEAGVKDVGWIAPDGNEMGDDAWVSEAKCVGMLIDGRAFKTGVHRRGEDESVFIVFNGGADAMMFTMPDALEASGWTLLADTNAPDREDETLSVGDEIEIAGRSVLLFKLETDAG